MQRTPAGEVVIVPRNFKLLEELEKSEKGLGEMGLSLGLVDPGDTFLSYWNGGILVSFPRQKTRCGGCSACYATRTPLIFRSLNYELV